MTKARIGRRTSWRLSRTRASNYSATPTNQGVGGATLTGYQHAAELGAEILVKMDADGQMDPDALPALLAPIVHGEADYTKGNRFLHARELQRMPLKRRIGNLGLSFLTKMASGYWRVFDPTNGYTALHASLLPSLDLDRVHRRYFFETSLLLELSLHRAVVRDVFIPARYGSEQSNLSELGSFLGFPPRQLRGLLRRVWHQHVMRDFGLLPVYLGSGSFLFALGFVFGAIKWIESFRTGIPASTGTVMLSVLPIIVAIQLLLQAVALDVQSEPSRPLHPDLRREEQTRDLILPSIPPSRTKREVHPDRPSVELPKQSPST
jgi:dolichol-phosphate mannosyltransferase